MRLGKWWLKHGPGSPGSIARAVAKDYLRWKEEYPQESQNELLRKVLQVRILAERSVGLRSLTDEEQEQVVIECDGSLEKLILAVVHMENPAAEEARVNAPKVYKQMLNIIAETVKKSIH